MSLGQPYLGLSGGGDISTGLLFRAGMPCELMVSDYFSIQTEIAYVQRENNRILLNLSGERDYRHASVSYMEMPILVKFNLPLQALSLYGLAGPGLSYGLQLSADYSTGNHILRERLSFEREEIARRDWGFHLGAGFEKEIINGRRIFLDFRYYFGLTNLDLTGRHDLYYQSRGLNLGFKIPLQNL